jgi:endoglucanase
LTVQRRCRLFAKAVTVAVAVLMAAVASAAPASASTNQVGFSGNTVGSTIEVASSFAAPHNRAGNYLVDTEIYGPNGNRVAQWFEEVWLDSNSKTRNYSWNTAGLAAGKYRVAQGVFTPSWSSNVSWVDSAGSVDLVASAPKPWQSSASVTVVDKAEVQADFNVPSGFASKNLLFDVEVYSSSGSKVAQWFDTTWAQAGSKVSRSYSWDLKDKAAGEYVVKLGVFSTNWSQSFHWNGSASKFTVSKPEPSKELQSGASVGGFWVDPNNPASAQAKAWESSRSADAAQMRKIAAGGAAVWLGGWNADVSADVASVVQSASKSQSTPVFVVYNIPGRDCGHFSAGGAHGSNSYKDWVRDIAKGVGGKKAWFVLEPDALSQLDCLDNGSKNERLGLLKDAVNVLESSGDVNVYLDAGHPNWHSSKTMADRLRAAGVDQARGFALNVSNFTDTGSNVKYGEAISSQLGGKDYVVDTSRNGNGANNEWCNPRGRALGAVPTTDTGAANADAFVWIKRPGESDGWCNGGPGAGQWWADYALDLARNAGW